MDINSYQAQVVNRISSAQPPIASVIGEPMQGLISEIVYNEEQPWISQFILLPLLLKLGLQSRWQLWVTPQQKLSRQWVQAAGLPLTKLMQVSQLDPLFTVDAMIRALQTGNYSVVIGWLPEEITEEEHICLTNAAERGNSIGFIMRPVPSSQSGCRPRKGLKIHSGSYH